MLQIVIFNSHFNECYCYYWTISNDKHSNQILFFLIQKLKIFNAMLHFGDQIFGLEIVETTIFQFEPGFVLLGPYLCFAGERSICKIHKN